MQFYFGDFLADPAVIEMTLEERGAYVTLLGVAWIDGSIPADHGRLARLLHVTVDLLESLWITVGRKFVPHPTEPDRLVNPRMERERTKQEDYRQEQADKAAKGGDATREKWRIERERREMEEQKARGPSSGLPRASPNRASSSSSSMQEREPSVQCTTAPPDPAPPAPLSREEPPTPEPPDPEIARARDAVRTEIRARTGGIDPPVKARDRDAFDALVTKHGANAVIARAITFWRHREPPGLAAKGVPGIGWFVKHFAAIEPAAIPPPAREGDMPPVGDAASRRAAYVEPPPARPPEEQRATNEAGLASLAAVLGARRAPAEPSAPSEPPAPVPKRRTRRGDERLTDPRRPLGERQRDQANALRESEAPSAEARPPPVAASA